MGKEATHAYRGMRKDKPAVYNSAVSLENIELSETSRSHTHTKLSALQLHLHEVLKIIRFIQLKRRRDSGCQGLRERE